MTQTPLHFILRYSFIKVLIKLSLFLVLGFLLLKTIPAIFVFIILFSIFVIDLRFIPSHPILEISYLDGDEWTIRGKVSCSRMKLTHCFVNVYFAVMFFRDETNESKQVIYVVRDQLVMNDWKVLKKYINLSQ